MQYNFEGRNDLVKFFKLIQEHDMYAVVRIGPFIQAEWNHGFVVRVFSRRASFRCISSHLIFQSKVVLSNVISCSSFFRGLPYWLREVPDIVFRTNNEPFKVII